MYELINVYELMCDGSRAVSAQRERQVENENGPAEAGPNCTISAHLGNLDVLVSRNFGRGRQIGASLGSAASLGIGSL